MSFGPSADDKRRAFAKAYRLVYGPRDRAQSSMVDAVVGITVGALVIALIGVVGVNELADLNLSSDPNASHSNWSDGSRELMGIFDLIVVLAFLLLLIGMALRR